MRVKKLANQQKNHETFHLADRRTRYLWNNLHKEKSDLK